MTERERADEHADSGLSDEELEQEGAMGLPDREAMSLIGGGPLPMFPLDDAVIGSSGPPMPADSPTYIDDDRYPTEEL